MNRRNESGNCQVDDVFIQWSSQSHRAPCVAQTPESGTSNGSRHAIRQDELRKACGFFKILGTYPVDVH